MMLAFMLMFTALTVLLRMRNTVADTPVCSVGSNLSLEKHITYPSCMESVSSFIELTDMHFMLGGCNGKATGAVRRCRENTLVGECQTIIRFCLLTADSERR
jgi:hypothetical protein